MTILITSGIEKKSTLTYDVCIIGSGISGQLIASELKTKKVILVESGSINFEKDIQTLNNHISTGLKFRDNNYNRIRQLGGSANLWANQLMLLNENDFIKRDWIEKNQYLPLTINELNKYYNLAINKIYRDKFKKIGNLVNYKHIGKDLFEQEFIKDNIFNFNNHFWPSKIEKFNYNSIFTKNLIKSKKIDLIHGFTATDFEIDEHLKKLDSIKFVSKNKEIFIKANHFVLACGAIENARLLLNNRSKSKLLENKNIGKYFMEHPRLMLGQLKSKKKISLNSILGVKYYNYSIKQSLSFSKNYLIKNRLLNSYAFLDPKFNKQDEFFFKEFLDALKIILKKRKIPKYNFKNFKIKSFIEQIYFTLPPQISSNVINNLIRVYFQSSNVKFSFNEMNINYQGEQFPNFNSYVSLVKERDMYNQLKCELNWKLSDLDYHTINHFVKVMYNKFKNHDYLSFDENIEKKITDASHHMGTTRMSLNDYDGVVDKNCKFHNINNLFISGNSVLRTSGSSNPGLTNMALSLRLGEYINNNL